MLYRRFELDDSAFTSDKIEYMLQISLPVMRVRRWQHMRQFGLHTVHLWIVLLLEVHEEFVLRVSLSFCRALWFWEGLGGPGCWLFLEVWVLKFGQLGLEFLDFKIGFQDLWNHFLFSNFLSEVFFLYFDELRFQFEHCPREQLIFLNVIDRPVYFWHFIGLRLTILGGNSELQK